MYAFLSVICVYDVIHTMVLLNYASLGQSSDYTGLRNLSKYLIQEEN